MEQEGSLQNKEDQISGEISVQIREQDLGVHCTSSINELRSILPSDRTLTLKASQNSVRSPYFYR